MKKLLLLTGLLITAHSGWAADAGTKNELLQGGGGGQIELPDVKLNIDDESAVPINNQTNTLSKDTMPDYGRIDLDELTRAKPSDRLKADLAPERSREDFSLSAFKLYYGLYENFLADVHVGKRLGPASYLLTYLRNKKPSSGTNLVILPNTGMEIDDLSGDIDITLTSNLSWAVSAAYYARDIGLFTNAAVNRESKLHVPAETSLTWFATPTSILRVTAAADYLSSGHTAATAETRENLLQAGVSASYDINWGKDNFLKMKGSYAWFTDFTNNRHSGQISFSDKFPVGQLSMELGAFVAPSSAQGVFWNPLAIAVYKFTPNFSLRGGMWGDYRETRPEKLVTENQYVYKPVTAEGRWVYGLSCNYSPLELLKIKAQASYQSYGSMWNYSHDAVSGLYSHEIISNTGVIELEATAELLAFETLSLNASYQYRHPLTNSLLLFHRHKAGLTLEYTQTDWGFTGSTRLSWQTGAESTAGNPLQTGPMWDIDLSQKILKDFYAELKLKNLLNQENFDRPAVPGGGFNFIAGVRILLK